MLSFFDPIRDLSFLGVLARMVCAMLCGGIVGMERVFKRRPAGFRTHILICVGASLTTLTSQFLVLQMGEYTDMARLGAQVIAGIGFIGAGSIIVTRRKQVKGLTTAAGLWVIGIVGLCCGAGYYEAALYATFLMMCAELFFAKIEYRVVSNSRLMNLYVEYKHADNLGAIVECIKQNNASIVDVEVTKSGEGDDRTPCVILSLQLSKKHTHYMLISSLSEVEGVLSVEEL